MQLFRRLVPNLWRVMTPFYNSQITCDPIDTHLLLKIIVPISQHGSVINTAAPPTFPATESAITTSKQGREQAGRDSRYGEEKAIRYEPKYLNICAERIPLRNLHKAPLAHLFLCFF